MFRSAHRPRTAAPALAGALVVLALGAGPAWGANGASVTTNPASSTLAPVSGQARPGTAGTSAASSALGSPAGSNGTAAGGTGAQSAGAASAGGTAAGSGTSAAGTPAGAGIPTTTYAPPATSGIGRSAPGGTTTLRTLTVAGTKPRKTSTSISTGAILLAALAALLALAAAAWGVARWQGYEPHWSVSMRHAMAEAGFRASATWAEFTDWVRLGR